MSDITKKTLSELVKNIKEKKLSSEEVTNSYIDRSKKSKDLNAYITENFSQAIDEAKKFDRKPNFDLKLPGIPIAVKDLFCTKNVRTTAGSKILNNFIPTYESTVTQNIWNEGAILLGKLNCDEFAMGSSNETSFFGNVQSPIDKNLVPGGSSGGSASAVAGQLTPITIGTDTGGSIRQPAAFCGVVGMKPTYGLVSRYGLVAFASSLDQVGPLSRNVKDSALLLETITGHDPLDSTSLNHPKVNYSSALDEPRKKMTLGVPKEFFQEGIDQEIKEAVEKAIKWYESEGYAIEEISLPHSELCVPVYYIIATAEASSNLARFDGVRYSHRSKDAENILEVFSKSRGEGFGEEVKRRIILGTYVLSSGYYDAYYLRAQKVRSLIRQDFEQAFAKVDAIITPTSPTPAFKRGEKNNDPLAMYLNDIYTISVNLAGLPALSLPVGMTQNNLPIGMQVIGKAFGESDILRIAHDFEMNHEFKNLRPTI